MIRDACTGLRHQGGGVHATPVPPDLRASGDMGHALPLNS